MHIKFASTVLSVLVGQVCRSKSVVAKAEVEFSLKASS